MLVKDVLEKVKNGELSVDEAEKYFKKRSYVELGYAKVDSHRKMRQGFSEVVFCSGKSLSHLLSIYERIYESEGEVLGTRASLEQYEFVKKVLPKVTFDETSKILKIEKEGKELKGNIVVCSAGTSDMFVAEEAAQTAEFFGTKVTRLYDVGVSGIHRLLDNVEAFDDANCVVVCAGMEGALASVVGGLVSKPVIAVPTSIGYGANFKGLAALLTMINSCANGISVVNIDNGFGAGYIGTQINRIAQDK